MSAESNIELARPQRTSVVFVLGGPGSGKGTMCERIVNEFDYTHLSTGDLLEIERKSGSVLGGEINSFLAQGMLVPSNIVVQLIKTEINSLGAAANYIIDGFPRNVENMQVWNQEMSHCKINFAVCLDCSDSVMESRLVQQRQTTSRSDDSDQAIETRLKIYNEVSKPVIDQLAKDGLKVHMVNAEPDKETVYMSVRVFFKDIGDRSCLENSGDDNDDDGEVVGLIYEAPDGFRGTYDEVAAHEAMLEEEEEKKKGQGVVNMMHNFHG